MANNRLPLTANKDLKRIEELPVGDNLDLTSSGIVNAESIESKIFYGDLVGIASTAISLTNAENILDGIIDPDRLSGDYDINISGYADSLLRAENILDGIIDPDRLSGEYNIDITGTSKTVEIESSRGLGVSYLTFVSGEGRQNVYIETGRNLTYRQDPNFFGINVVYPERTLDVDGDVRITQDVEIGQELNVTGDINTQSNIIADESITADVYYGNGVNLVGIVTQIVPSIGINIKETQLPGKGVVTIDAYNPVGKTIFVSQNGNDDNSGLTENDPKRTIKAAATVAVFGDTIRVNPGIYLEDNPIILKKTVSVEGTELRNCVVTPRNLGLDLFHVNNGCHITDLSFIGPDMTDGAAIVAFQPLQGVSVDRFFDAARMIRMNLDYISTEAVGFLTSGFSGFAGNHREQDAARLIDDNIEFIAAHAVGFLTATAPNGLGFTIPSPGTVSDCAEDIKDIFRCVSQDLKANSNRKSIGAALSYFGSSGELLHITGIGVSAATIKTLEYAVGIAKSVINKVSPPLTVFPVGVGQSFGSSDIIIDPNGCVAVGNTISSLVGIVTSAIGAGSTNTLPSIRYGVNLETDKCANDVKRVWKCIIHDITRGGNTKCIDAGKAYYDNEWNLIPEILKNPYEVAQTVATLDYSFNIARSVINNSTWGGYPVGLAISVTDAEYDHIRGITTITADGHNLNKDDAVKIVGLGFTCPSGPGVLTYPTGAYGYIFNVKDVIDEDRFEVVVGYSTLPHTYVSGGSIQKYTSFQKQIGQVKDLSMQIDPLTGFNNSVTGCANVVSALHSCVGIITHIVANGASAFSAPIGIRTTYPGNTGIGFTTVVEVTNAVYDNITGKTTITAPGLNIRRGELVELRDLVFSCSSGGPTSLQIFPSGAYGNEFYVDKINVDNSFDIFVGISTLEHTYEGGGVVVNRSVNVTDASYDNLTGIATITALGVSVKPGDLIDLRDLEFSCSSGAGTTTIYPTGNNGYKFRVLDIVTDTPVSISTASYNNTTGTATIVAPNFNINVDDLVELRDLKFSCSSGAGTTTIYPTGNNGYRFRVLSVVGSGNTFTVNVGPSTISHNYVSGGTVINRTNPVNDTFTVNVGPSTISHNYVSGGIVIPPYSKGVGPIPQGPYVRNCTNFIGKSIGMKIEGFDAEPGDQDDIGVTGTMSVDSYTQYNQGGIGVSITNGAYAQLVSIFTICDDMGVYTGFGGQCDITNSNSSFGRYGLVSEGVGDQTTKSIYHYTGVTHKEALEEQAIIEVSGIGSLRPYDGQAIYFGQLYYTVQKVIIENGGSGYDDLNPPSIIFSSPEGENGITAEALCTVNNGTITSVDLASTGTQYTKPPKITITGGNQSASLTAVMAPIYYTVESATLPSAGITTIILNTNLNNTVSIGTTVYFSRLSLQIVSSHSFEWVGSGNDINKAKPSLGGVVQQENEVVKLDGGECVYTSTDQAGNFRIGDGVVVNQLTGTVSGRAFSQSLLSTVTPLIVALG